MAEIHKGTWIRPTKLELLTAWMGQQRWYAAKGAVPSLTLVDAWRLGDPAGEVGIETMIVLDEAGPAPVFYQVPLTYRGAALEGADAALVGTMEHGVLGHRWIYDATHDPVYAAQLLAFIRGTVRAESSGASATFDDRYRGVPARSWPEDLTFESARVLSGEQSNTSIIIEATSPDGRPAPVIVKVFRVLAAGQNPDVVLQSALRDQGCDRDPAVVGHVEGHWPLVLYAPLSGESLGDHPAYHLAFAQEFLPGVEDAWRVATRAVMDGTHFDEAARALGAATAEVHATLAATLGTTPTTVETGSAIVAEMRDRFAAAVTEVPELDRFAALVDAVLERAAEAKWPPMQRIHGDFHLGQVLHSPERGWILLDFEGEPMRPLAERSLPDQWIRDVAGMLRSFDYCGSSWELTHAGQAGSARAWVTAAQTAFLEGYAGSPGSVGSAGPAGSDPRDHEALLTAFELDKAMYEVVYEARNRPDWVSIPLAAIERLTAGVDAPLAATEQDRGTEQHRTQDHRTDQEEQL